MVSTVLRTSLFLVLAAAGTLALWLWHSGFSIWVALAAAAVLPLALHGVPLAIEFVTGALVDRRPLARLGPIAFLRLWWSETWRSTSAFDIVQPWRANFIEPQPRFDPARPAVLLVPGYMCNRAVWRPWLLGTDLAQRWNVATVNLEPAFGPIEAYVAAINSAVERLRAASGAARIILVCHSMGGLVARAYLRLHGASSIERVITLNTPHAGTMFAGLAHGDNARQMRRGSDTLRALAAGPEPVEFITFASQHDNLIVPRDSQVLPGAETVWFERVGHLAMTANSEVLLRLVKVVERPPRDRSEIGAVSKR